MIRIGEFSCKEEQGERKRKAGVSGNSGVWLKGRLSRDVAVSVVD